MNTPEEAYKFLVGYMDGKGGEYPRWYAGIAADPNDRLASGHRVIVGEDPAALVFVPTSGEARTVEEALLTLGCDGGPGGGGDTANGVYVYRKSRNTRERC
jgi:hypothetical protein